MPNKRLAGLNAVISGGAAGVGGASFVNGETLFVDNGMLVST